MIRSPIALSPIFILISVAFLAGCAEDSGEPYGILLRKAQILDGSGSPAFSGDVGFGVTASWEWATCREQLGPRRSILR